MPWVALVDSPSGDQVEGETSALVIGGNEMSTDLTTEVEESVNGYDPAKPAETCDTLRELWLQFEPKRCCWKSRCDA